MPRKQKSRRPRPAKKSRRRNPNVAGGSATAGGINFQAAVTACVATHVATGEALQWLIGVADDVPTSVTPETGAGGDDIAVTLHDGRRLEAQVKKGLKATERLWVSLMDLARGLHAREFDYGVLVVCPDSSATIRQTLAGDLVRMAAGRFDRVGPLAKRFSAKLTAENLSSMSISSRLRIVTMHCLDHDLASVVTACSQLKRVCADARQIHAAWDRLYRDAADQIAVRGRRTPSSIAAVLTAGRIALLEDARTPTSIIAHVARWTAESNALLSVNGIAKPLSLDSAWIQVLALIQERQEEEPTDLAKALKRYHDASSRRRSADREVAAQTIGWFVPHCVILAGPGMGKSTLCMVLARRYAQMGHPVLRVQLRLLAARMRSGGHGVEEGLIALGLDGSRVASADVVMARLDGWTLVCDGMDETAEQQTAICEGLLRIVTAQPGCRVIVTTRPVGYHSPLLASWRHYDLQPLQESSVIAHAAALIEQVEGVGSPQSRTACAFFEAQLAANEAARVAARSPLLLTLMVALAVRKIPFAASRVELYERLFRIYAAGVTHREHAPETLTPQLTRRFLEILGWILHDNPGASLTKALERCAEIMARDLGITGLSAARTCEQCLAYWENHGMIERLRVASEEALTFIHRTFGEYAAARYLVSLPTAERKSAMLKRLSQASWKEVFEFSLSMGAANDLVEVAITETRHTDLGVSALIQCLTAIASGAPEIDRSLREAVINMAVVRVCLRAKSEATSVGASLLQVYQRYPDEVRPSISALVSHENPWTRLVAWALLMSGAPAFDQTELLNAFRTFATWYRRSGWRTLGEGFALPPEGESELIESFVVGATRYVVANLPEEAANDLLRQVFKDSSSWPIALHTEVSNVLSEAGRDSLNLARHSWAQHLRPSKAYLRAQLAAEVEMLESLRLGIGTSSADEHPFEGCYLHLSAFLEASGYWNVSASDVWNWPPTPNRNALAEVLRGLVHCARIPVEPLSSEVTATLAELRSAQSDDERSPALWRRTLRVDIDVDSTWIPSATLSMPLLEQALLEGAYFVTRLATFLLLNTADTEQQLRALERLLPVAHGNGLWAAGVIAAELKSEPAVALLLTRLRQSLVPGCEHLFRRLAKMGALVIDAAGAIRNGLFATDPEIALSAAELLAVSAHAHEKAFLPLLREAYEYWQKTEEPYPVNVGTVPTSPRAILLRLWLGLAPPTLPDLISHESDPRSDIRDIVTPLLMQQLAADCSARNLFLQAIAAETLKPTLLRNALKQEIAFSEQQVSTIRSFLRHSAASLRIAAMTVLSTRYLPADQIAAHLNELRSDPEGEIRDKALSLLP